MFNNIGGKIKTLAKIICWIGVALTTITGVSMFDNRILVGLIIIAVGFLVSWIGSFVMVGFGELIESSSETRDMTRELLERNIVLPNAETQRKTITLSVGSWVCTCGRIHAGCITNCACGGTKPQVKKETKEAQHEEKA